MCHDNGGLANHFPNEVANQIGIGFRSVVNRGTIRETKAQQINSIDAELLGEGIDVLAPLVRRGPRPKAVNEQERPCFIVALHLVEHIPILPGKTALLTCQHRIEFVSPVLRNLVNGSQCSKHTADYQAASNESSCEFHLHILLY